MIAAFVLKLPVCGVYALHSAEEGVRLFLGLRRLRSRRWIRALAAERSG